MLLSSWQLKTVYILFLTTCLGQELFRACERNYCYQRSTGACTAKSNDLRSGHRYNNRNLKREISTSPTLDHNQHGQNFRIPNDIPRQISNVLEKKTSDVTRYLDNKNGKQHAISDDCVLDVNHERQNLKKFIEYDDTKQENLNRRETPRRLYNRHTEIKSEDYRNYTDHHQLSECLARMRFVENQDEGHESVRQLDQRDVRRWLHIPSESQRKSAQLLQRENKSKQERYENQQEPVERHKESRRLHYRKIQTDEHNRSEANRESQRRFERFTQREYEPTQRRVLSKQNYVERRKTQADLGRHSDTIYESQLKIEQISQSEKESMQRRHENRQEHAERREASRRLGDHGIQSDLSRRSDYTTESQHRTQPIARRKNESIQRRRQNQQEREERSETLSRMDNREIQTDLNRLSDSSRKSQLRLERFTQRKNALKQQRLIERREALKYLDGGEIQSDLNIHPDFTRTLQRRIKPIMQRENEAVQRLHENQQDREDSREFFEQLNNRDIQSGVTRRSDFTGETQRTIKRSTHNANESKMRRDENQHEHVKRIETSKRLDNLEIRTDLRRHHDDTRESQNKTEWFMQRENKLQERRAANVQDRVELREATRRLNDREIKTNVDRRSDVTQKFQHRTERLPQREHQPIQRRDENIIERMNYFETSRRFENRDVQADESRRTEVKYQDNKHVSRFSDHRLYYGEQVNEKLYKEKQAGFFTKGNLVVAHGAILAYVIMKTLNGKNDLKNQLPIVLREVAEIICF